MAVSDDRSAVVKICCHLTEQWGRAVSLVTSNKCCAFRKTFTKLKLAVKTKLSFDTCQASPKKKGL